MARRPQSRHALPRGRAGLQAANAALQKDIATLRWSRWGDQLEMTRLQALVEGLGTHVERLAVELAGVRADLQDARSAPVQRDPSLEVLAVQAADLRATVATQEAMLSDLTARFHALLAEVEDDRAATARAAASRAAEELAVAAAAAAPAPVIVDLAEPAPARPAPAQAPAAPDPDLEPVFAAVGALRALPTREAVAASSPGQSRPVATIADAAVDDETVRRLRLIRESYGG